jgi:RNA recognition motif-containing protein
VPLNFDQQLIIGYFKHYGQIEEVKMINKQRNDKSTKNICFVLFKNEESFNSVLQNGPIHSIQGLEVRCSGMKLRDELKNI